MPNDVSGGDERAPVAKSARPPGVGRDPQRSNSTSLRRKPLNPASKGDSESMGASLLGQIMVTELLDGDERPPLIIDLENQMNTSPGALNTLFVNEALRSIPGLLDRVYGVIGDGSGATATFGHYPELKAWMLESENRVGSLKPQLSFEYASYTWRGGFLGKHKRLKAISAIYPQHAAMGGRQQATDNLQSTMGRLGTK